MEAGAFHAYYLSMSETPRPIDVIRDWVDRFNAADAEAVGALYTEDAVNHQMPTEPVEGREAIETMFREEFAAANMTCVPVNWLQDGEWVALEWRSPTGMRGCGFFRVQEGRIVQQRGYWDRLTFLREQGLPIPDA